MDLIFERISDTLNKYAERKDRLEIMALLQFQTGIILSGGVK